VGLLGIFVALAFLIFLAFRGWSILLLAPMAGLIAATFAAEPLLASWTQTFMLNAAQFMAQFFPLFLLGALFGKLMEDSGSVSSIANYMTLKLGPQRAILAVVLAGAIVTYGGVSLFVAFFGMWWLKRVEVKARAAGEGFGPDESKSAERLAAEDPIVRERATTAHEFDPAEIDRSASAEQGPPILLAALPIFVVIAINLLMSFIVLPRMNVAFLAEPQWGATSLSAVGGVWSVIVALLSAVVAAVAINFRNVPELRATMTAGSNAAVLPIVSVASLVGFGAIVAALPSFALVREWVLGIEGGPLVSLAIASNILAALTGSASGGLTIALDALGPTYMKLAAETGLDPALMHRVAVIGSGTLDSLPHNGAVVTLLSVCGVSHKDGYLDIVMAAIVGALIALIAVILLGSLVGSF
jgi:H+/gluconate symporter-like permease